MIHRLKVVFVFGLIVFTGASAARAQGAVAGAAVGGAGIGVPGFFMGVRPPAVDPDGDISLVLPVPLSVDDLNGVTDRFGMPLMGRFVKGSPTNDVIEEEPETPEVNAPKRTLNRTKAATKRTTTKGSTAKRPTRAGTSTTGATPLYRIPRGSLDWDPGMRPINTSPANPYGYGYGLSGYGTEVFGDFWKGWPIVE